MSRPELHVITDTALRPGRTHAEIARAAFAGGADVVQLRDKRATAAELVTLARELVAIARDAGRELVVNDHLPVALAAGAHGLHLGPQDLPPDVARRSGRRPRRLGGSARTIERARELWLAGCDYLGVGPVYGTATKAGLPPAIGLGRIEEIAASVPLPVFGIGGIDASNAAGVIRAGAAGIAVVSCVAGAEDPEAVTRALRTVIDRAWSEAGRALADRPNAP